MTPRQLARTRPWRALAAFVVLLSALVIVINGVEAGLEYVESRVEVRAELHPVSEARIAEFQARLDAVRSSMKYGFLSSLSTPDQVASRIARYVALTGDVAQDAANGDHTAGFVALGAGAGHQQIRHRMQGLYGKGQL